MTVHMTIELDDAVNERLQAVAEASAKSPEEVLKGIVAEGVDYKAWFIASVKEGFAAADRGELIDHEEVVARAAKRREMLLSRSGS